MQITSMKQDEILDTDLLDLKRRPIGASLISVASTRLSQLLRSRLNELVQSHSDIGLAGWRIYTGLAQMEEATQKELVSYTKIEQSHISRALVQMEQKGDLVSRQCDIDRRARRFCFTPSGRAKYERLLPVVETYAEVIDQALSTEEVALYLNLSQRLAQVVETAAEAASKKAPY